jgi:hypothetical protein
MAHIRKKQNFHSLSVKDLLEARECYHVFLSSIENVIGTAVGLYRIRVDDPDAEDWRGGSPKQVEEARLRDNPRTLDRSVVRPWSWPSVLVFVKKWVVYPPPKPENLIPRYLYLPDGRMIPTCVVHAPKNPQAAPQPKALNFPEGLIGGGYPVLTESQGEERVGSLAALVSDGHTVYALTNRHVAGEEGDEIHTVVSGNRERFGVASNKGVGKVPFVDVYPGWKGNRMFVNADACLIRVDNLWMCTSQVYGIGEMGEPVDLNVDTIGLNLIGLPVRAYGGASGRLEGEIQALFYRYRAMGGDDNVADFLIGPRASAQSVNTMPGDSGTMWFWDGAADQDANKDGDSRKESEPPHQPTPQQSEAGKDADKEGGSKEEPKLPRPLALQWGGQSLIDPGSQDGRQFALATGLSSILRLLDVDLVTDWETGHSEYWGKVGHYKIALAACGLVSEPNLAQLMKNNGDRIAPDDERIRKGDLPTAGSGRFVELADVSDLEWRATRKKDAAHHFADVDQPGMKGRFKGKTLLDLWKKDKRSLDPKVWIEFYDSLSDEGRMADKNCGALPFRVMQLYGEMVNAAAERDPGKFVCAAGICAHYVGDACQPLHISYLHHGRPRGAAKGEDKVHSYYDNNILDRYRAEMISGVNAKLQNKKIGSTFSGQINAGHEVMGLMDRTWKVIPPMEVIKLFNSDSGVSRGEKMWKKLRDPILETMADGALTLAKIWESAWKEGGGDAFPGNKLAAVDPSVLRDLYDDKEFLKASWLREMAGVGNPPSKPAKKGKATNRRPK